MTVMIAVAALALPQIAVGLGEVLLVSASPDRASPVNLEGAVVSGRIYVFTSPDTSNIASVDFWLDDPNRTRPRIRRETGAPYDFAGGKALTANSYDTMALNEGTHTITARFNLVGAPAVIVHAAFTVDNVPAASTTSSSTTTTTPVSTGSTATSAAPTTSSTSSTSSSTSTTASTTTTAAGGRRLVVSTSPNRTAPVDLQGAAVAGNAYVFTTPDTSDIVSVEFWLDDPNRTRPRFRLEGNAPYDFNGGTAQLGNPYNTALLTEGSHTITARFNLSGSSAVTVHGVFTVDNIPAVTTTTTVPTTTTPTTVPVTTTTVATTTTSDPGTTTTWTESTTTTWAETTTTTLAPPAEAGVDAVGERFFLDGTVTNPASAAEGFLLNSRMIMAISDIGGENSQFVYPDTLAWDAERNVSEFLAALPSYAAAGLDAVTVGMQGGNPLPAPAQDHPSWIITGYEPEGTPKADWLDRLGRVLSAAEANGLVVVISLFYFGQDDHLADEPAVINATDMMTDWLLSSGHRNIIVEVANESGSKYDHAILRPDRVDELINRVIGRSTGAFMVGTSFNGGVIPPADVIAASDVVLVHGNGQSTAGISSMVTTIRGLPSYQTNPKPIVFNEDSTDMAKFEAAITAQASWGYHDKGANDYLNGFQAPPINWTIGTSTKQVFFDQVSALIQPVPAG